MSHVLTSRLSYKRPATENLIQLIKDGLPKNSHHTLIIGATSGRAWTGKDLEVTSIRIAQFLIEEFQFQKGDVCSIYGPEDDLIAVLILAIITLGGTYHYLSDRSSGYDLHDTATVLKTKFLFSNHELLQKIYSKQNLVDLEEKLTIISFDETFDKFKNGCHSIKSLLTRDNQDKQNELLKFDDLLKRADIKPDDYAVIQFSSGTTGKPKPIIRTHKNLVHLVASVDHEELMDLKPGVVLSGILPITHRPGIWALLASVTLGNTFVIWDEISGIEDAMSTIQKYKVTVFSTSLPFLSSLGNTGIQFKDKYDLSTLKHIITAGAKIVNQELPKLIVEKFDLLTLRQCFGMTESGWVFLIEKSLSKDKHLTVGHIVPGMEAVIANRDTGQLLGAYERGEILLRGPQIFPGYLTSEPGVLNRLDFTEDGWFKIGDEGYYDKDELIFIEGRYKEKMLFSNDMKYYPTEIEAVINQHPAVELSCVVKVPNKGKDYEYDIGRAYVTLNHGYNLIDKEIVDFLQERAPEVLLEGGVRILEKFPRLQNGKVDKQTLASYE